MESFDTMMRVEPIQGKHRKLAIMRMRESLRNSFESVDFSVIRIENILSLTFA